MQMNKDFNWDHVAYWEHYKGGKYVLLDVPMVWLEEDMDKDELALDDKRLVVYRSLENNEVYARRKRLFFGDVEVDGVKKPRFRSISWREVFLREEGRIR